MKKRRYSAILAAALAFSTAFQTFAAGWIQTDGSWYWQQDDDSYSKNAWQMDSGGIWYYLGADGKMQTGWVTDAAGNRYYLNPDVGGPQGSLLSGWKLINNVWYFFNTNHDGTFGRAMTGWQWIDGYSYCFDQEGRMYVNVTTPDGYFVNESGAWTENGIAVYVKGKGILTQTGPSGTLGSSAARSHSGSGGGGGGGGGGGSHGNSGSNTQKIYTVTITCLDNSSKEVLGKYEKKVKEGEAVSLNYSFDGYRIMPGQQESVSVSDSNLDLTLYFEKNIEVDEKETYHYTINYVDEDGKVLKSKTGKDVEGTTILIDIPKIDGYEVESGYMTNFILDENNKTINIVYLKSEEKKTYSFTIKFVDKKNNAMLGFINGSGTSGDTVYIDVPDFETYVFCDGQETSFILDSDNKTVLVYYEKEPEKATPSEPETIKFNYKINCRDFETDRIIASFTGYAEEGEEINPDYVIEGYTIMEEYSFAVDEDDSIFDIYYTKDDSGEEEEEVSYTIRCLDEKGRILQSIVQTGCLGEIVEPSIDIDGYRVNDDFSFELTEDGMILDVYYSRLYSYTIYQYDIDTMDEIGTIRLEGTIGEELSMDGYEIDGYELADGVNIPDEILISGEPSNNEMKLYYKNIANQDPEAAVVHYTIRFVDKNNHSTKILNDISREGYEGESIVIYFPEEVNTSDGRSWKAIGYSPKVLKLSKNYSQTFDIEYINTGEDPGEDTSLRAYSIKYIADDTDATLGITTGYAAKGTLIPYMNVFDEYGISDNSILSMTVSDNEDENNIEVYFKRTKFPGPDKNEHTGTYDGCNWTAIFTDESGNTLLPEVRGFTIKNSKLLIEYPDTIEGEDGTIYRAKVKGPYNEYQSGTTYRQIKIEYTSGNPSENKLEEWKNTAQSAKDEFLGTTPYSYYINYKERNSWNDIALVLGMGKKNTEINISTMNIDGYTIPTEKVGSFTLNRDGMTESVYYDKYSSESSSGYNKVKYTINFEDADGNPLFPPYTGYAAIKENDGMTKIPVYYPDSYTDAEGSIWEAVNDSPSYFNIEKLTLNDNQFHVVYEKAHENEKDEFVVENETQALDLFKSYIARANDADIHTIYMIGKNYYPKDMAVGDILSIYSGANYSNSVVDTFEMDGNTYTVCRIEFSRTWESSTCHHAWEAEVTLAASCTTGGSETIICRKCNEKHEIIIPASGHIDEDNDSVCDICGERKFYQQIGDEIIATFDSGNMGVGKHDYTFICVDDDYKGTGKMLYLCEEDISSDIYGTYSENGQIDYENSSIHYFLNDNFADGLGNLALVLQDIDSESVSVLTYEEYTTYKNAAENKYLFPDGTFITKDSNETGVRLSDGTYTDIGSVNNYPIRPIILLDRPDTTDDVQKAAWKTGDLQARTIGDDTYIFRCVSEAYKDKTNTSKNNALFLCDSVIPADIMNDEGTEGIETLFFGTTNNYKTSLINEWLERNKDSSAAGFTAINVGVDASYSGSTRKGAYSNFTASEFKKTTFQTSQYMKSQLFVLSLEEAINIKDYLWKFNNSNSDNADTQIAPYCDSYWLRTPETGSDDKIYVVDLKNGNISTRNVSATEQNNYSTTGIRPAFVIEQP